MGNPLVVGDLFLPGKILFASLLDNINRECYKDSHLDTYQQIGGQQWLLSQKFSQVSFSFLCAL